MKVTTCPICARYIFDFNMHGTICYLCYANYEEKKMSINRWHITLQTDFRDKERDEVIKQVVIDFAKQLVSTAALISNGDPNPKVKVIFSPFMQGDLEITIPVERVVQEEVA